jgi:hypothetical protein
MDFAPILLEIGAFLMKNAENLIWTKQNFTPPLPPVTNKKYNSYGSEANPGSR